MIGMRLVPLLVEAGHEVAGMTRSPGKAETVRELGAEPVVVDVFDAPELREAVVGFGTDLIMHQLTNLPDDASQIPEFGAANARIRTEGTRNLLGAAKAAGADRFLAQSIAWRLPGGAHAAIDEHEALVLDAGGVVLRYGQFHGPGTYFEHELPEPPRVSIETAARRTVELLDAPSGVITVVV